MTTTTREQWVQPAQALIRDELELSVDDFESLFKTIDSKDIGTEPIQAQTKLSIQEQTTSNPLRITIVHSNKPVDQLKNARRLQQIREERPILQSKRQQRLKRLHILLAGQVPSPHLRDRLSEIQGLENRLVTLGSNSVEAQEVYFQKSMLAVYYQLPLAYVEADSLAWQIESMNATLEELILVTTKLNANDAKVIQLAQQLDLLIREKESLVMEMNQRDQLLLQGPAFRQMAQQIKTFMKQSLYLN